MENTEVDKTNCKIIKEGQAEILVLEKNVFYNPVQEFNRDLSVAVLNLFAKEKHQELTDKENKKSSTIEKDEKENLQEQPESQNGIRILEALSATGLRSIRYAKEVPHVKQIIANDISEKAVESIKKNILHNKVENLITPSHEDATMVMYESRKNRFDAVDLDPYGCPSIFLDGAVQSVSNGGLLLVTATDMAVLAGNSPETCYVKYGAVSLKSKCCHEMALRILLQHISSHAGRYGRYIVPQLSISVDFYIRVFVRVYSGQIKCKNNTSNLGMIYQCKGCESMTTQPLGIKKGNAYRLPTGPPVDQICKYCKNHKHHIGGPIWLGQLHDKLFVQSLVDSIDDMKLGTQKRLEGVLNVVLEELDTPLYYALDRVMSIVRCDTPAMVKFRSALLNAGYQVSYSHANKISIKTDAPNDIIWDIVRAWEKLHPAKRDRLEKTSAALGILETESTKEISFDLHPLANPESRKMHLSRFQLNPTANWGPGARSTTMIDSNTVLSKTKKNQNKNFNKRERNNSNEKQEIENISTDDFQPSKKEKIDNII